MTLYIFPDISHWAGAVDPQVFADAGYRLVISKASDNYNLPDKNGQYYWQPQRHYDSRFYDNFTGTRQIGLSAGAYHFVRWDRPLNVGRPGIVQANLDYFMQALGMLPDDMQDLDTVVLDMEQSGTQLKAAGLTPAVVSAMAKDIVTLFQTKFKNQILYSGSWWSDVWLTKDTTQWMSERMSVWEPEYVQITSSNRPVNENYKPSLPYGFKMEYATTADDIIGKVFAWQFTEKGKFPGINAGIDLSMTGLPKSELYKLFNDGSVEPPAPNPTDPPGTDCKIIDAIRALLDKICL